MQRKGCIKECIKWGPGQGGDSQEGRKMGQFPLSFRSLLSGIQSAKFDLQPFGLVGDFLVKIFSWHMPSSNMAIPVPHSLQPIPKSQWSQPPLCLSRNCSMSNSSWHCELIVYKVFNDKGGKLTMGQFPHPLVTPQHFLSIKNYTKRTSRPVESSGTLVLTTKVYSSGLTF